MPEPSESGARLDKPARSWPAWATGLVALVVVLVQLLVGVSASSYSGSLDRLDASVTKNTEELKQLRGALGQTKLIDQRVTQCEGDLNDHEARIRVLEKR